MHQKELLKKSKNGKFNIKKLLNQSIKWHGLNGLDLAKNVSTRSKYKWNNFKTWKKELDLKRIKKIFLILLQ